MPISQSTHVSDPASSLYFPATHSIHGSPSGPVEPALQAVAMAVQAVAMRLPLGEVDFDGHASHGESDDIIHVLYFPASHSKYGPP